MYLLGNIYQRVITKSVTFEHLCILIGSALAVDLPSDSEVNQQTTGYAGVISIALASRKIPPMLS